MSLLAKSFATGMILSFRSDSIALVSLSCDDISSKNTSFTYVDLFSHGLIFRYDSLVLQVSFRADQDYRHIMVAAFFVDCVEPLLDVIERALLCDTVAD